MVYLIIQSVSEGYKTSNDGMILNKKLEEWKVAVVQSNVLSQHLTGDQGKEKGPHSCQTFRLPHFLYNVHAHCLYQGTHQAWAFPFPPLLFALLILHHKLTCHTQLFSPPSLALYPKHNFSPLGSHLWTTDHLHMLKLVCSSLLFLLVHHFSERANTNWEPGWRVPSLPI